MSSLTSGRLDRRRAIVASSSRIFASRTSRSAEAASGEAEALECPAVEAVLSPPVQRARGRTSRNASSPRPTGIETWSIPFFATPSTCEDVGTPDAVSAAPRRAGGGEVTIASFGVSARRASALTSGSSNQRAQPAGSCGQSAGGTHVDGGLHPAGTGGHVGGGLNLLPLTIGALHLHRRLPEREGSSRRQRPTTAASPTERQTRVQTP